MRNLQLHPMHVAAMLVISGLLHIAGCSAPANTRNVESQTVSPPPDHVNGPTSSHARPPAMMRATSTDLSIDLDNIVDTMPVCGKSYNIWQARSQHNAHSTVVEPAWIITVNQELSHAHNMFCVDAMTSSPSFLSRAKNALPLPLFMAEFELVAAGTNVPLAPIIVRDDDLAGTSKLCFDVTNNRRSATNSQIKVRYAVKSKSASYSSCTISIAEDSEGAVTRTLTGPTGSTPTSGEVWVTRRQLEDLLLGSNLRVHETCYASAGGSSTSTRLEQQRVRELLPVVLPAFEREAPPITEAMRRLGAFAGQDAGARLTSYLQKKSEELHNRGETTFDGSVEAEAKLLDLVSGKGKTTMKVNTIQDDLKKANTEVSWDGQLIVPATLDVYLVGRTRGQRGLEINSTNVAVLGERLLSLTTIVDIYDPHVDRRVERLTPLGAYRNWQDSLTLTDPNDSFDGDDSVTYHCSGSGCGWSRAVNRSRPVCVMHGKESQQCEYGADYVISRDRRSVTVYRSTDPGQHPAQEYRIAIKRTPSTICPGKDTFLP